MKRFFKNGLQQKYLVIIAISSVLLLVGGASFALFTMHLEYQNTVGIKTGTLTGELKVDGTIADKLTVNPGENKEFTVTLRNNNDRTARYLLYYTGTLPSGLEVGYIMGDNVVAPPETNGRNITVGITETYKIKVKNNTTSSQTIQLKLDVGLEKIDLTVPNNGHLFEKMQFSIPEDTPMREYINSENAEFNENTKNKMFVYHHEAGEQQVGWIEEELTDYRYIGANPNNYVTFNGEEAGWRIIGVFTVENEKGEKEQRIKLIHDQSIGQRPYNTELVNDWTNASLMKQINPNTGSTIFNLNSDALEMTGDTKWYLGPIDGVHLTATECYSRERSTKIFYNRPIYWIGKVALIYPSDYGFATDNGGNIVENECLNNSLGSWSTAENCRDNDWIFKSINKSQWVLSPYQSSSTSATIYSNGTLNTDSPGDTDDQNRPSLYLTANVRIKQGKGTQLEPFVFTK